MKKIFIQLIILFFAITVYSQEKGIDISITGGLSQPMGNYKTETVPDISENYGLMGMHDFFGFDKNRKGKLFYNLDVNYRFSKLGIGLSLGHFNHLISDYNYHIPFKTSFKGGNLSGFYFGIGPNYNLNFSKLKFTIMLRAGMANYKYDGFQGFYAEDDVTNPVNILETVLNTTLNLLQIYLRVIKN